MASNYLQDSQFLPREEPLGPECGGILRKSLAEAVHEKSLFNRQSPYDRYSAYSFYDTSMGFHPEFSSSVRYYSDVPTTHSFQHSPPEQQEQEDEGGVNHVLRVVVEKMIYPVPLEVLTKVFTTFGPVKKIITFKKNDQFQALIEMSSSQETGSAKLALDGRNIYQGCCTLRIDYSKMNSLNVKFNNDKSRDYTKILPPYDNTVVMPNAHHMVPVFNQQKITMMNMQQLQMQQQQQQHQDIGSSSSALQLSPCATGGPGNGSSTSVLHLSNLNEGEVTSPDILFTLLGVFGDVQRVKILYQKKSSALVQMTNSTQAALVKKHLSGLKLLGKPLQIAESRHSFVQMPKEGQDELNLTRDYTNSNRHRFKKAGSKNFSHIYPPSEVLHLSNIPEEIDEQLIVDAFKEHRHVVDFKFFAKDRRMALIKLSSVEDAIYCLVKMHNYPLTDSYCLRVSFSKGHF